MTLDEIFEEIKVAEKIVILSHETPDGDAIGSCLAMKVALKSLGKQADVIIPERLKTFDFLPTADEIKTESEIKNYDLAISVDCTDLKRLAGGKEYFETAKKTIEIDHHSVNAMFADLNYVNPVAPACCQVLIAMFEYWGIDISIDLGTCILTGIITDTGGFQWGEISPETFEFAAELIRKGVNIEKICNKIRSQSREHCELVKLVYDRMEFFADGKIVTSYITLEDENRINAELGDKEGLVEICRDIEGVEIAILLKEKENSNGFKCSFRSKDYANVSNACFALGGGGHHKAAGCFVSGTVETVKNKVVAEATKVL